MIILAVDDEQLMLDALTANIVEAVPDSEVHPFRKASDALAFAQSNKVDVAFLDIRMRGMDGLELGRRLLNMHPELNIIFCTSYDEYISEAFREIRCNGYITKPVDPEQIAREMAHLRVPLNRLDESRIILRCMGYFEAYLDGEPIKFESAKTKELLAYIVDGCGAICPNQDVIAHLWEDDNNHDSYFKKIRKDLLDTMDNSGCGDIIFRQRGGLGINTEKVKCDYYDWRKKNPGQRKPQEYMTQYEWANVPEYEW